MRKNHNTVAVSGHPNPTHRPSVPGGGIETNNRVEPLRSALRSCFVNVIIIIIIILFAKLTSYIKNILDTTLSNRLTNVQRCCNSRNQTLENKLSILFLCFWPFYCHFCQLHRGSSPKFHKVSTIMHAEASTFKFHACAHFEVFLGLIRSVLPIGRSKNIIYLTCVWQ